MKIIVTGATGFTGRRVLPLLQGKGNIRCFVRPTSNRDRITCLGYDIAQGDLRDSADLARAMSGCDTLVNIASIGFGHAPTIIRAAEDAGIQRAVFISTTALFTHLNAPSKVIREQAEQCIKASRLKWTILRPTMIYGAPDDRNMIRLIRWIERWPIIPVFGSGEYVQQPVFVEDVAQAIVGTLTRPEAIYREFSVCGEYPLTLNEIIDCIALAMGKKVYKIFVPYRASLLMAHIYERLRPHSFFKAERIMRLNEHKKFDYSDAKKLIGFHPISFEEGITEEIRLYRESRLKNNSKYS
jgi:nucleoside-diphosphate-sugar epimerase